MKPDLIGTENFCRPWWVGFFRGLGLRFTEHVAQRLRLLALDRSQRGNLGWPQDCFVGRENELRLLRSRLLGTAPAAPVALVGIGGIGKTALALTFAFREAAAFPGGCWLSRCEGRASLAAALASLVRDLDITLTEHKKTDDTLAARRVLATLRPRLFSHTHTGTRPPRPRQPRNAPIHPGPKTRIDPGCNSGMISQSPIFANGISQNSHD